MKPSYGILAAIVAKHPTRYAPHIAELYGVKPRTAQRWIYEGRKAGKIPPCETRTCRTCGGTGIRKYGRTP